MESGVHTFSDFKTVIHLRKHSAILALLVTYLTDYICIKWMFHDDDFKHEQTTILTLLLTNLPGGTNTIERFG